VENTSKNQGKFQKICATRPKVCKSPKIEKKPGQISDNSFIYSDPPVLWTPKRNCFFTQHKHKNVAFLLGRNTYIYFSYILVNFGTKISRVATTTRIKRWRNKTIRLDSHISHVTQDGIFLRFLESRFISPGIFKSDRSTPKNTLKTGLLSLTGPPCGMCDALA
jgi:hypothetical protein